MSKMLLKTMLHTNTDMESTRKYIIKWENVRSKRGLSFDIKWARSNRNM